MYHETKSARVLRYHVAWVRDASLVFSRGIPSIIISRVHEGKHVKWRLPLLLSVSVQLCIMYSFIFCFFNPVIFFRFLKHSFVKHLADYMLFSSRETSIVTVVEGLSVPLIIDIALFRTKFCT